MTIFWSRYRLGIELPSIVRRLYPTVINSWVEGKEATIDWLFTPTLTFHDWKFLLILNVIPRQIHAILQTRNWKYEISILRYLFYSIFLRKHENASLFLLCITHSYLAFQYIHICHFLLLNHHIRLLGLLSYNTSHCNHTPNIFLIFLCNVRLSTHDL